MITISFPIRRGDGEALAHTIKNNAEEAYARSDLFEKRRALMESWAQYLTRQNDRCR